MLEKRLTFPGQDAHGNVFVEALRPDKEKLAHRGTPAYKLAGLKTQDLHPDLGAFIEALDPVAGKLFVLVNALGAGEYWGCNLNADWMGEDVLSKEDPDDGYKSFLKARVNRHHRNKDEKDSFGRVALSVWNAKMHRVELLLELDRQRTKELGHQDLLDALDAGEHPAVSMGLRTSHDICSTCGNKSKTDKDYCLCLKEKKRQILEDGRVVCMINPQAKFFDISFVLIGADPTAYAIAKVAHYVGQHTARVPDWAREGLEKVAALAPHKEAALKVSSSKLADLIKEVPAMEALQAGEPSLPRDLLNQMGRSPRGALATSASLGIVLKPHEFQRIVLIQLGRGDQADRLDRCGACFRPCAGDPDDAFDFSAADVMPELLRELIPLMSARSALGPPLEKRVRQYPGKLEKKVASHHESDPLLDKISAAYDGYRNQVIEKISGLVQKVALQNHPALSMIYPNVLEASLSGMPKTAGAAEKTMLFGVLPAMYLLTRAFQKAEDDQDTRSTLQRFMGDHPVIAGSVLLGLLRTVGR